MGVLHRLLDPAVSEDRLQPFDAAAVLEIVGREGVPQIMGADVSGAISAVSVVDNQYVHRGDGLYVIDPGRFRLAAASAQADVEARRQDMLVWEATAQHCSRLRERGIASQENFR